MTNEAVGGSFRFAANSVPQRMVLMMGSVAEPIDDAPRPDRRARARAAGSHSLQCGGLVDPTAGVLRRGAYRWAIVNPIRMRRRSPTRRSAADVIFAAIAVTTSKHRVFGAGDPDCRASHHVEQPRLHLPAVEGKRRARPLLYRPANLISP